MNDDDFTSSADPLSAALAAACGALEERAAFYHLLLETFVYVPGEKQGRSPVLQCWKRQDDNSDIIPFFSTLALLEQAVSTPSPYLRLQGREVFRQAGQAPLILNPFSETNKEFSPGEAFMLRLDSAASVLLHDDESGQAEAHLLVGVPDSLPGGFLRLLSARLDPREDIRAVYAAHTFQPDTALPPRLLLALEGLDAPVRGLAEELELALAPLLPEDMPLDLIWLDDEHPLRDYLLDQTAPLYRKGLLGRLERSVRNLTAQA